MWNMKQIIPIILWQVWKAKLHIVDITYDTYNYPLSMNGTVYLSKNYTCNKSVINVHVLFLILPIKLRISSKICTYYVYYALFLFNLQTISHNTKPTYCTAFESLKVIMHISYSCERLVKYYKTNLCVMWTWWQIVDYIYVFVVL